MKKLILSLLLSTLAIEAATPTTWYVAKNGSDSNPGTSVSASFLTVQKALNTALTGDTILVRAGTYVENPNMTCSGVLLSNYNGEVPTIFPAAANGGNGFTIGSGNVDVIKNLVTGFVFDGSSLVSGSSLVKITERAYGNVFSNNIVQFANGQGILLSHGNFSPAFNVICHNQINTNAWKNFTTGNTPHSVYISDLVFSNIVEDNLIHEFAAASGNGTIGVSGLTPHGVHMYSGQGTLLHNIVRRNTIWCNSTALIPGANYNRGIGVYNDGNEIYENVITNCHVGINFSFGSKSNLIANNTVAYNGQAAVHGTCGINLVSPTTTDNLFINNIIANNYGCGFLIGSGVGLNTLSHNLISKNRPGHNYEEGSPVTKVGNLIDDTAYDPMFALSSSQPLSLLPGSPAINAGVWLPNFTTDFAGTTRPSTSPWDVGAFSSTTQLPPPLPAVSISTSANAAEPSSVGSFEITRFNTNGTPLKVIYSVGGTAIQGADYQPLSGSVVFTGGELVRTVTVTPIPDNLVEGDETVTLTILPSASYTLGSPTSAVMVIKDTPVIVAPPTPLPPISVVDVAKLPGVKWFTNSAYIAIERSTNNMVSWDRVSVQAGTVVTTNTSPFPSVWVADYLDDKASSAIYRKLDISKAEFDAFVPPPGVGIGIILYRHN